MATERSDLVNAECTKRFLRSILFPAKSVVINEEFGNFQFRTFMRQKILPKPSLAVSGTKLFFIPTDARLK
jgi:hypothetical protein